VEEETFIDEKEQKVLYRWLLEWPSFESGSEGKPEKRRGVDVIHFKNGKILKNSHIQRPLLKSTEKGNLFTFKNRGYPTYLEKLNPWMFKNDIFLGKTPPFGSVPFFEMILLNIRMAFLVFRISALQVKKPRPRCPILANWYD
jgi:hypothetical protein